ncbi:Putative methyltransferase PMT28 [Glycine soja]|nr:Putative methyltransferase PMT28 [Glycine soja]
MAIARLVRQAKRPHGLWVKMTAVTILGLCFIFVWGVFSSSSTSVTTQRESFEDIAEPVSSSSSHKPQKLKKDESKKGGGGGKSEKKSNGNGSSHPEQHKGKDNQKKEKKRVHKEDNKEKGNHRGDEDPQPQHDQEEKEKREEEVEVEGEEERVDRESEGDVDADGGGDLAESVDQGDSEAVEDVEEVRKASKGKVKGPLFNPNATYSWKLCSTRSKHNYIPCIDIEVGGGKVPSYRHTERSCPRTPFMCMVPLPHEGYGFPLPWPESKLKILYKNVAHPKLAAYIKRHNWLMESGEYLTFPQNQSELKGGIHHYLESIEEMVPDIEWGKNIRVVLDIGCTDSSFAAALLDKEVLTLSLGLKNDLVDLAQVALERGIPAVISPFSRRRLPFPSQSFDAIHCGGCGIPWHSNGGKLLLEMNRILRPGGYFIMSTKHDSIEEEEAMTTLTASICWNVLAHKSDDVGEVGVKIYQKPEGNDIYELRRKKVPPICKENENPDAAWYVSMKTCLHTIPIGIEQHGAEWPEEWPKRLESYPDWVNDKEKVVADTNHWNAVANKSYLNGLGINWTSIRNVMDMKSVYGGLAVALSQQKVWVMNVVPVHAPDTLPIIFERGLIGIYHDWCESFGTYPRTYDLLHADHLFSRLKNRCKQPVTIVVEVDRILRPGGWIIIRDKVEILNPLEEILKSMQWEIRMTFAQDKEGILCAQKTMWRGYKIIGSHSGVKLCRWTKAQLRGRGGCYKHSFYGIESHRCMEATPSLACANKCVFCWRHHTNPVGKSWQWQMDDPIEIVNSAIDLHTNMIKQMKGVPGVTLERLSEGLSPRHCALSLVGEPIMYPGINALVDELHKRRISTFLVTNAQFPEKIKSLKPVTQLYVSVDAATKDSLKAIDRPLFGDFWERFIDSLTALKEKHQRTVYRLTLVKGWNTADIDAYSKLFSLGEPDFAEIKGVTYCGSSTTSKLTMDNVPWHADVKAFSEALALKSQGEYEVACEHAHSCCVLLAKTNKFKIDGQWYTWIDYEKFHDLVASGRSFDSRDYMAATPSWSVYGSEEGGFDPGQLRYRKERHHKSTRNQAG